MSSSAGRLIFLLVILLVFFAIYWYVYVNPEQSVPDDLQTYRTSQFVHG